MKKELRFIAFLLFAVFACALTSCGNDDDDVNGGSPLVGTWTENNVTIIMRSDGTGTETYDLGEYWNSVEKFSWTANDNQLIWKLDGGRTYMYYYSLVDDDTLVLYYSDFEYRGTYTRR